MRDAIQNFDWHTVQTLVNYGHQYHWFKEGAFFCAQILIFFFVLVLLYLWYAAQPVSYHHSNKKAVMLALVSLIFAVALKMIIAMIYFRARPFVTHPDLMVVVSNLDPQSFPSGHALVSATITASLWLSGMRKLGFWLAIITLFVAFGRVAIGVHYPTDVLGGIVLGILSAWALHHESSSIKKYLPNT